MRHSFDGSVSQGDALKQVQNKVKTGRKHTRQKGAGKAGGDNDRKRRMLQAKQQARLKRKGEAERAYWNGAADEHPK